MKKIIIIISTILILGLLMVLYFNCIVIGNGKVFSYGKILTISDILNLNKDEVICENNKINYYTFQKAIVKDEGSTTHKAYKIYDKNNNEKATVIELGNRNLIKINNKLYVMYPHIN